MLGATPEIVSHHSNMLLIYPTRLLYLIKKKNKHYIPLVRPRERTNEKAHVGTNVPAPSEKQKQEFVCRED